MVMNKTSSINGQFNSNSINNNGPSNNGHLISNGKSSNSQPFYGHDDAQRIEQYKASILRELHTRCAKRAHAIQPHSQNSLHIKSETTQNVALKI